VITASTRLHTPTCRRVRQFLRPRRPHSVLRSKDEHRFTDVNIYWLKWGEALGLRISTVDGSPDGTGTVPASFHTTLRVEHDQLYNSPLPSGTENDHWYWKFVSAGSPTSVDHSAVVPFPYLPQSPEPTSATVRGFSSGTTPFPSITHTSPSTAIALMMHTGLRRTSTLSR